MRLFFVYFLLSKHQQPTTGHTVLDLPESVSTDPGVFFSAIREIDSSCTLARTWHLRQHAVAVLSSARVRRFSLGGFRGFVGAGFGIPFSGQDRWLEVGGLSLDCIDVSATWLLCRALSVTSLRQAEVDWDFEEGERSDDEDDVAAEQKQQGAEDGDLFGAGGPAGAEELVGGGSDEEDAGGGADGADLTNYGQVRLRILRQCHWYLPHVCIGAWTYMKCPMDFTLETREGIRGGPGSELLGTTGIIQLRGRRTAVTVT